MSPLRAAIRKKHRDLVLLLLCNGYRLDLERDDRNSVLDEALKVRDYEMLDRLLQWGADPTSPLLSSTANRVPSRGLFREFLVRTGTGPRPRSPAS